MRPKRPRFCKVLVVIGVIVGTGVPEAAAAGEGAASLDGIMIDAATARIFGAVLERARRAGLA